jgi:hypothetical protein
MKEKELEIEFRVNRIELESLQGKALSKYDVEDFLDSRFLLLIS